MGTGFMGRTHSNAYHQVRRFFPQEAGAELVAVCSRDEAKARDFAAQWGFRSHETDWRKLVGRDDIDLIDIASPNDTHAEIAVAAAKAGKMVACEKPLGRTLAEARRMVEAVERAGVANMIWYNYRRVPALALAKQMIEQGQLGRIFHSRFKFLQDWTMSADLPQGGTGTWRLDASLSGSGVTGDLLAHCIDAALWLVGPFAEVCGTTEVFIRERMHALSGKREAVTAEDASLFLARFANGSLASFEATRFARGHKALFTLEVNGEHGSIAWDLHDLHRLQFFSHHDEGAVRGWRTNSCVRQRPSVHEGVVGAGSPDRIRAHVRASGRRLPERPSHRREGRARLSRRPCGRRRGGRSAAVGPVAAVGGRRGGCSAGQSGGYRLRERVARSRRRQSAGKQAVRTDTTGRAAGKG